jgi:hypothetical protein
MKRRGTLLFLMFLLMGVGMTAFVLSRIARDAAQPFPGARVILYYGFSLRQPCYDTKNCFC